MTNPKKSAAEKTKKLSVRKVTVKDLDVRGQKVDGIRGGVSGSGGSSRIDRSSSGGSGGGTGT